MKKVKLEFPIKMASAIADIIGENQFVLLMSYAVADSIFSEKVVAFVAIPNEKEQIAADKFKGYIQKD